MRDWNMPRIDTKPAGKVWAAARRYRLHLADEAPRIGSGQRLVWVIEGRRWVRLYCCGRRARLTRAKWLAIPEACRRPLDA